MKERNRFLSILVITFLLPISVMMFIAMSGFRSSPSLARPDGPCDIYKKSGTPCVTAHSTTRALFASYNGPLYQVMRQSDGKTLDIGVVPSTEDDPGGYANAAAQDAFCANTLCWITTIYDQSGHQNHLVQAPPGTFKGPAKGGFNTLPIADMAPITIMGHKVYGVYIMPGMGLRNNDAVGLSINDEPQGVYMVFDGTHFDNGCCFNYGNTSTNSRAVGRGTMSTVYFGTSTAWGRGSGQGPWIMSDMEAGLFSGYNTKLNVENPTIDSWRFVTGMVNGGGGNQWEIRGGNAQEGQLKIFYKGIRPESKENDFYYPMHQKGAVQMGNGGDNGNGSAGTFYEGIITSGYPAEAAVNAVQANIVSAKYDVPGVSLSRITSFYPQTSQEVTLTYTNTTGIPVSDVKLSVLLPAGWTSAVAGTNENSKTFTDAIAAGSSVKAIFRITSSLSSGAGYLTAKAEWKSPKKTGTQNVSTATRIRNVLPVKINEIRLGTNTNPTNQFIELFNASDKEVDISNWSLINTRSEWASVKLATIPSDTKLAPRGFYLLGLAGSGLAASVKEGETTIQVLSVDGFQEGQQINIGGEIRKIKSIGTPASVMTTVFVPVSTGPWLTIPAGSTNLPVTNASGFVVGQKIGIDMGGKYEEAVVTSVGKAATQTNLSFAVKTGDRKIKVAANSNMTVGDILTIGTGARKETVKVKRLIKVVAAPVGRGFGQEGISTEAGEVELSAPLKFDHMIDVDVSCPGTGISFSPATRYEHKSGDALQALGSGITLENALDKKHEPGTVVLSNTIPNGYKGDVTPDLWYGAPLSATAGSLALMDESGLTLVDALVYGSQQSNSSANGTIPSPEIATLEGDQKQGGCIVVVPGSGRGFMPMAPSSGEINKSIGRYPDGSDTDNNCSDYFLQNSITLLGPAVAGSNNIKVNSVAGFYNGQNIIIGSGSHSETITISNIGTSGGTILANAIQTGSKSIVVTSAEGFTPGQTIFINTGTESETAVITSISPARRRFGMNSIPADTIKITSSLKYAHEAGKQVSGSGITISSPLKGNYESGTQIVSDLPTPGKPNKYLVQPPQVNVRPGNEPIAEGKFEPAWESLKQYKTPEWYRNAKFGIWAHWGPQCQPGQGDWYARLMYNEGSPQYKWHVEHYGHPSNAGFKEVINSWKAEKWDPEKLVAIYKRAGAQYFFAMANHHDNLDMWNSKYQEWNTVNVGPKKDILSGWAAAAKKNNLPFGLSVHAAHAWSWFETSQRSDKEGQLAGIPYDGKLRKEDGKGTWWEGLDTRELYAQNHPMSEGSDNINTIHSQWNWGNGVATPSHEYVEKFYNRTMDMINQFHPDLIYFDDTGLPLYQISDAGLKIAAHYYNSNMMLHNGKLEAVLLGKILTDEQKKCMVWDVERGAPEKIQDLPWQTCSCIGDWHYNISLYENNRYKTSKAVIQMLIDVVSKNGNMLLNIPVRGDGTIDEKEIAVVEGIAKWMDTNKESIFDTRPWKVFGEGPSAETSNPIRAQGFNEGRVQFTAKDIRFNQKGNILYVSLLGIPEENIQIKNLGTSIYHAKITKIEMLGSTEKIKWTQGADYLEIKKPGKIPNDIAVVFKIQ